MHAFGHAVEGPCLSLLISRSILLTLLFQSPPWCQLPWPDARPPPNMKNFGFIGHGVPPIGGKKTGPAQGAGELLVGGGPRLAEEHARISACRSGSSYHRIWVRPT